MDDELSKLVEVVTSKPLYVAGGLRCPRCRYPLQGLPMGTRTLCPECGAKLDLEALRRVSARRADPAIGTRFFYVLRGVLGWFALGTGILLCVIGALQLAHQPGEGMVAVLGGMMLLVAGVAASATAAPSWHLFGPHRGTWFRMVVANVCGSCLIYWGLGLGSCAATDVLDTGFARLVAAGAGAAMLVVGYLLQRWFGRELQRLGLGRAGALQETDGNA